MLTSSTCQEKTAPSVYVSGMPAGGNGTNPYTVFPLYPRGYAINHRWHWRRRCLIEKAVLDLPHWQVSDSTKTFATFALDSFLKQSLASRNVLLLLLAKLATVVISHEVVRHRLQMCLYVNVLHLAQITSIAFVNWKHTWQITDVKFDYQWSSPLIYSLP